MKQEKSCGCIVIDNGKVLLIKHILGHWDLPKGHIEEGETEFETAIRELKEETNIDVKINEKYRYKTAYSPMDGVWKEVIYFIASKIGGEIIPQEEEVKEAKWVDLNEAIELLTFNNTKKILKNAINDIEKDENNSIFL